MSRTKKDRPVWVKRNDKDVSRTAEHDHLNLGRVRRYYNDKIVKQSSECTIDDPQQHPSSEIVQPSCYYDIFGHYGYWGAYKPRRMKKDDRRNNYYIPLRNAERKALTNAQKEYNTTGDVEEDIIFLDSHRNVMYGGGYWD